MFIHQVLFYKYYTNNCFYLSAFSNIGRNICWDRTELCVWQKKLYRWICPLIVVRNRTEISRRQELKLCYRVCEQRDILKQIIKVYLIHQKILLVDFREQHFLMNINKSNPFNFVI